MKRKKLTATLLAATMLAGAVFGVPANAEGKDTIVIMDNLTSLSLDPYAANGGASGAMMSQIYDTLFQYGEDGEIVPALAESWEESEDGRSYTVHLREGVKFTDGTDFNADVVVHCYGRILELPGTGASFAATVAGIEKVDDYTVIIEKATPYANCLAMCATLFFLYSPTAYEADPDAFATTSPVGCGPYVLESWDQATGTAYMTANEDYWGGAPAIKNLELRTTMDESTALVALETGELDMMFSASGNSVELAENAGLTVDDAYKGYAVDVLIMYGEPYVSDENLRTAISYAVNQENAAVLMGYGADYAAHEIAGDILMGDYLGEASLHSYDTEKAAEYLAKSSYAGETLEINVMAEAETEAVSIQADLMAIGINAQVNTMDGGTWYEKIVDGTIQMTIVSPGGPYGSVQESARYFTEGGMYESLGNFPMTEELNAAAAQLGDAWEEDVLQEKTIEMLQALADAAVVVPLCQTPTIRIYNSSLKGYNTFNSYRLANCYFE